jgi:hypothetical protein
VKVLGTKVGVIAANINASGTNGGGTVRIGGEYMGQGPLPNAEVTFISEDSTIQANAVSEGDGGRIIVWSEQTTRAYGSMNARGGANSGNGGFVETSSRGFLDVTNAPDVAAPNGFGGTWLIDPRNITIVAGADDTSIGFGNAPISNPFNAIADDATLAVGDILAALTGGATVVVSTGSTGSQEGNITLSTPLNFNGRGTSTLVFMLANDININASIGDSVSGNDSLNLVFNARNTVNFNNDVVIDSGGGGNVSISANNISLNGNTSIITIGGNISFSGEVNGSQRSQRNLTLDAGSGNITFNNAVGNTTALGILQANSNGTTRFNSSVNATSLTTNVGGTTQLNGDVTTSGVQSYGDDVQLDNSGNLTTSNANVTFAGTVNSQAGETNALSVNAGTGTITFGNAVGNSNALGNLSLTGDEINFGYTVTGTGDLIIQPSTAGLGSDIGGYSDTSSLDLTLSEIGFLQNGFNSITIGRSNGGNMTISGGTFNDPVILQSGSAIELTLSTTIRGLGNASVTLNAPTILNPNIITTDQDITLIGAVSFFYSVTLNTGNVGGGNITINGAVTEITPGFERLRLSAGSGNITITGDVGLPDRPLGSIEANTTGTTLFNSAVNAASLTTDAGGTTRLNGNVTTTGATGQSYGDNLRIDNNISLTGDEINFANTVTGTRNLTIQPFTTAQAIAIGGSGDTSSLDLTRAEIDLLQNGFNSITIGRSNGGNMTIAGATFTDPVILQSGSAIAVNGSITGADNASITVNAPTILNPNITTTDQDITLNGGVSLANSVALNTGATGRG